MNQTNTPCGCMNDAVAESELRLNHRQMIYYTLAIILAVALITRIIITGTKGAA